MKWRGSPALVSVLAWAAALRAGEGPSFQVSVLDTKTIYTATPADSGVPGFKPHINFPWLTRRGDGSLLVWFTVGQTHGVGVHGRGSISSDDGQTWSLPATTYPFAPYVVQMRPPGQISRGFIVNFYPDPPAPFTTFTGSRFTSTDGGLNWTGSTAYFDTGGIPYLSFYNNPGDVLQDGPTLMLTAFGQRQGVSTFENVLFVSADSGVHWTRRATIMSHVAGPNVSMGEEGPNESDILILTNGDMLSVSRTGQPFPNDNIRAALPSIFWTRSTDKGVTWSPPKMLGVMGAFPHLHLLPSGHVAMTYGRYGVQLLFADPTGTRWSFPTVIHSPAGSGQSSTSGYVRMHPTSDGKYVLAYDHSSFYPPPYDPYPPAGYVYANDQMAHMKAAILDIRPLSVAEEYNWLLEYHGDITPDTLPQPWTASQSGSVSAYLWADLGQDYIRTDTGAGGTPRSLYYTLAGAAGSAWQPIDFAAGMIVEMRARVGSVATAESAANLFLGDGVNGYVAVELTGSGVNLEGLFGNAGQVTYSAASHPGFLTTDWHVYRLVIGPDAAAGGQIRARLYLDENHATPILTQRLQASTIDEIRFGDQTGTNNGILDVDFLRFGHLIRIPPSDMDRDGDVDLTDFALFQGCFNGPNQAPPVGCAVDADFDNDSDVDLSDFAVFQTCFNGPNRPAACP